jgi:transposase
MCRKTISTPIAWPTAQAAGRRRKPSLRQRQVRAKAFVKGFAQTPVQRVVFEPTGPYHRAFERALGAAGVPFVKVNPRQARRFAEAIGKLAKTDRLDCGDAGAHGRNVRA